MYVLPTFNLTCDIFDWVTRFTPLGAARLSPMCNLAYGRRVNSASSGGTGFPFLPALSMTVLLPAATDVRAWPCYGAFDKGDILEVPQGSGRRYLVIGVDDAGKGFPNEHRVAVCMATYDWGNWPTPIP